LIDAGQVTRLLQAYGSGDRDALDRLIPLVYGELQLIARSRLDRSARDRALDTTGLVHETYLRLVDQTRSEWSDRKHFYRVCAMAMRQIVVSDCRRKLTAKRGGGEDVVALDEQRVPDPRSAEWMLTVDRALERLASRRERLARVFECRYFAGLTEQETADTLEVSLSTVRRDWLKACAWLRDDLGGNAISGDDDGA